MKKDKIASVNCRVKAWLIDFFLGFVVISVFWQVIFFEYNFLSGILIILTIFIYWIMVPYFSKGKTIGKLIFHIRIVDVTGKNLSISQILQRHMAYLITILNFIKKGKIPFDENSNFDHDRIAQTIVIIDT